jgi:transposase
MEAGTHSIWISAQLREMGHEVIVTNVRELRAISHSDRKSDQVDAEKLARFARHNLAAYASNHAFAHGVAFSM